MSFEYLTKLKTNMKRLLDIPEKHSPNERDVHGEALMFLTSYFQSTTQNFNLDPIIAVSVLYIQVYFWLIIQIMFLISFCKYSLLENFEKGNLLDKPTSDHERLDQKITLGFLG